MMAGPEVPFGGERSCLGIVVSGFLGWCRIPARDIIDGFWQVGTARQLSYRLRKKDGSRAHGFVNVMVKLESSIFEGPKRVMEPDVRRLPEMSYGRVAIGIPVKMSSESRAIRFYFRSTNPDGPLILSEIIDWYKKRKKKLMAFKVDFEKAFDCVSWKYLDYMLHKLGFSSRWRTWINNCLMPARISILINGSPTSEFSLKRGLRQGDHLSSFLFIIVMEGLRMALNDGIAFNMFHGVRIGSNIHLSHLLYADDVIILSDWNQNDMENITRILNIFYIAFGSFPFSYLGLPIGSNTSRIANWQILIDRFKARLSGWKANLLSIGGRLTLIKSVLGSLDDFSSIFRIPYGFRPITMGRSKTEFDNLIIAISNMEINDLVKSDTCVWSLSNDDSFSVNSVRKHIDEHSLHSLFPCTQWYKMIPKKTLIRFLSWFVMSMLNRMTTSFSLVTRLLEFGILFDHGLICLFQAFSRVKIGPTGLIHGMFLRTKRAVCIPSLRLLVGLFVILGTISHSTLIL
nr:RNA-directed DNA polymerase, eukaryota, reverse transcriptase zinc-binding domain protein [Tanacetum cinerariifolium]